MAQTAHTVSEVKQNGSTNDRLRGALTTLQTRLGTLRADARGQLRKALGGGSEALTSLDATLARVSQEDWTVDGMRRRIDTLRARAGNLRATAVRRVAEIPGTAVSVLATTTRRPVRNLARELDRLAKRLAHGEPTSH